MAIPAAGYWGVHTARAAAIVRSCDNLIGGALNEQFVVDVIQGGAGTSTNMNANEVIANRALEHMGRACGDYAALHPNDHVNASQSTKDGYPTALRVAAWFGIEGLLARHRRQHCRRGADVAGAGHHERGRVECAARAGAANAACAARGIEVARWVKPSLLGQTRPFASAALPRILFFRFQPP